MKKHLLPVLFRLGLPLLLLGGSGVVIAQMSDNGSPVDSSGSYEVRGIDVDITAKDAESARQAGWRLAQRKGWSMLSKRLTGHDGSLSDSALDSVVTGIIIQREEIGPDRYIARLGVTFSRAKAGSILGVSSNMRRSRPMLLLPLQWSGGVGTALERHTPWQDAWTRFRSGDSTIDYVRPTGTGPDSLLLNAGQVGRRGRLWWRAILNQYGAADVLIPQVHIDRQWPGGPIIATFTAGHGPDNEQIANFRLQVQNASGLPALLDEGVKRLDAAYQDALSGGKLGVDPSLQAVPPSAMGMTPEETPQPTPTPTPSATTTTTSAMSAINIQFDTPSASDVTRSEAALRAIPGVQSAVTTSLALGGVSVMRVNYSGNIGALRYALEAQGWQVQQGSSTLRISRPAATQPEKPAAGG